MIDTGFIDKTYLQNCTNVHMYCSGLSYLQLPPHSQCRNIRSINRVFLQTFILMEVHRTKSDLL